MFLHALLFFLLSTSAFASPAGSRTRGTGGPTYLEPEIPYNYHVGYWYLVETTLVGESNLPPKVLEIVSESEMYSHQLLRDGSLDPQGAKTRITPYDHYRITTPHVLWRRFPQRDTPFATLPDLLAIRMVNGEQLAFDRPNPTGKGAKMPYWTGLRWYKVPSLTSKHNGHSPPSATVIEFNYYREIVGIGELGSDGGVNLLSDALFQPSNEIPDPKTIIGRYFRIPDVSLLQIFDMCLIELYSLPWQWAHITTR
ncbi:hypothetical protein AX14_001102 [Amanita brunnescens Koide BX004]|nr:hypothetical protein AX14_001102 [Amanita brunnescens Koide BX004]